MPLTVLSTAFRQSIQRKLCITTRDNSLLTKWMPQSSAFITLRAGI